MVVESVIFAAGSFRAGAELRRNSREGFADAGPGDVQKCSVPKIDLGADALGQPEVKVDIGVGY